MMKIHQQCENCKREQLAGPGIWEEYSPLSGKVQTLCPQCIELKAQEIENRNAERAKEAHGLREDLPLHPELS